MRTVVNAVNFCKKCGDCGECVGKKIHRFSQHFLQNFTAKFTEKIPRVNFCDKLM